MIVHGSHAQDAAQPRKWLPVFAGKVLTNKKPALGRFLVKP
jgi:hypothetical protein